MSYQEIGERIKVLAIFKDGTIFPYAFDFRGRRHKIDKVNMSYQEREGDSINYFFAIEAGGLVAKMSYNDKKIIWNLEEIWVP